MVFTHDMSNWLSFNIDKEWLEENISWRDFETGVRLGKLKREEKCSLVLYDADSKVTVDAFMPHMHPGGEAYLVLEGEVWDDEGTYPTGSIVWMNRETTHTPKTRGKTLILVLWPKALKPLSHFTSYSPLINMPSNKNGPAGITAATNP